MTQGTFVSLCTNPVYYLQNDGSFDRIRGSINVNILNIICENNTLDGSGGTQGRLCKTMGTHGRRRVLDSRILEKKLPRP